MEVQCFATVSPSGNPGAHGLQGQLLCLNTGNLSSFLTSTFSLADSAWATHKRVANPDSYPLSQEESKLILTPGQRPSPGLSCYLDQPDGERPKESRVATENTTGKSRSLPLSLREGKLPLRCLPNTVKQHFGCGQTQEVANVLIPSTSLCAQHSSRSFRHTDQYSSPHGRAPL